MFIKAPTTHLQHLLLIAAFAIIAMLPMYFNGVTAGNDQAQHYQFAWTVYGSLRSGEIYPSVAGDTNRGFGDVGLRFYPPITYYILAAAYGVVGDWFYASMLAFTLVFFAGGTGIYFWAREELDQQTSLIAAAVYTFAPYHLNVIYTGGLMAEFFASAILPFCFLFLTRVCRGGKWVSVFGLSVAGAMLALTHLPLTIIAPLAMAAYALVLINRETWLPVIGRCLSAGAVALLLTAFYWARMLPELEWVKHSLQSYFQTTWGYAGNYLLHPSHFTNFGEASRDLWFGDLILAVTVLIAAPSIVWLATNKTSMTRYVLAVAIVIILSVFMATPLSGFIWDNFGFLQKVQFPWRWLSIATPFIAVLAAVGIKRFSDLLNQDGHRWVAGGLGAVLVVFVFMAAFIIKGSTYSPGTALNEQVAATPSSTGCECWWPVWAGWSALDQRSRIDVDGRTAAVKEWTPDRKTFEIGPGESVSTTIAAFYYPHWHARVNGTEGPLEKTDDGRISVPVPAEGSEIELTFREPAHVTGAYAVSMLAWTVLICFFVAQPFINRRRPPLLL